MLTHIRRIDKGCNETHTLSKENTMDKKPNRMKRFVQNHPHLMLGVTSGLAAAVVLQNRGIKNLNDFLKQKGLFDEYYYVDEE